MSSQTLEPISGAESESRPERPLSSFLVWGPAGAARDEAAVRLARWWDAEFRWVEIQDPADPAPSRDLWLQELAGHDRVWKVRQAGELLQNAGAPSSAVMWSLLRPDQPPELMDAVTDFLTAPDVLQQVISESSTERPVRCVVIANIDRLDPTAQVTSEVLTSVVRALNRAGITPIFTCTGRPQLAVEPGRYELYVPLPKNLELDCPPVCLWGAERECLILKALPGTIVRCRRQSPGTAIIPRASCRAQESRLPLAPSESPTGPT